MRNFFEKFSWQARFQDFLRRLFPKALESLGPLREVKLQKEKGKEACKATSRADLGNDLYSA